MGVPLGIAALGFLGFLILREQNLHKYRRDNEVALKTINQEYSPTGGSATLEQPSPVPAYGEMLGDTAESELVAPAPVYEI